MKALYLSMLMIFTISACAGAQGKYSTYTNPRFAYSIEYPADLLTPSKIKDESNSGETFYSKNKEIEMRVWGEYYASDQTWEEWYKSDLDQIGTASTYTVLKDGWYVISGLKNGKIFYKKTLRRKLKEIDVLYTVTIEYPTTERAKFDAAVARIAKSFKFDPTADV
jgi:hypothetical protein